MRSVSIALALAATLFTAGRAGGQTRDRSRKWEIVDNSFLIEESFNQERGVFQNIFTWTRQRDGTWDASITQEWPVPATLHQLSYTLPFARNDTTTGLGDLQINYRYQVREESAGGPAIAPRVTVIVPSGRSDEGLGNGTAGMQVNVPVSKQFGDFYVHANAGFTWLPDVQRTPHLGGSGIWRAAPMLNVLVEAVVDVDESATLSPGFRRGWNIGDRQLVVGAALPLTRRDGRTTAALLTYLSYELPFR